MHYNLQLIKLESLQKQQVFFQLWVAKEAFIKAIGKGLAYDLASVEISIVPNQLPKIAAIHCDEEDKADWEVYQLTIIPNYVAALAVKGHVKNIKIRNLNDCIENDRHNVHVFVI